jgi:FkbM family methyltransferase
MCINYFDEISLKKWFEDNGDNTHRINYNLNQDSIVFDLGGYIGEWSDKIQRKYDSKVYIFEPVFKYFSELKKTFEFKENIKIYNFGLSDKTYDTEIIHDGASSSLYLTDGKKEKIKLINFVDFIKSEEIKNIDLIKINIEGGEYDLLDFILENNLQTQINNFQIQFHKMFDDCEIRRNNIREKLSETHTLTYDYTFVWENWEKKKN